MAVGDSDKFLNLNGLTYYDEKIKEYIDAKLEELKEEIIQSLESTIGAAVIGTSRVR